MSYLPRSFNDYFDIIDENNIKTDIVDEGENYTLIADLPNFNKDDINIEYNSSYLTITASRSREENNYIQCERFYGEYKRSYYVGDIDESLINASYNNGTLKVTIPKSNKEIKHQIEIK